MQKELFQLETKVAWIVTLIGTNASYESPSKQHENKKGSKHSKSDVAI